MSDSLVKAVIKAQKRFFLVDSDDPDNDWTATWFIGDAERRPEDRNYSITDVWIQKEPKATGFGARLTHLWALEEKVRTMNALEVIRVVREHDAGVHS